MDAGRGLDRTFTVRHDGLATVQVPVRLFGRGDCLINYRLLRVGGDAARDVAAAETRPCVEAATRGFLSVAVANQVDSAGVTYRLAIQRGDADKGAATLQVAVGDVDTPRLADGRARDPSETEVVVRVLLDEGPGLGSAKVVAR